MPAFHVEPVAPALAGFGDRRTVGGALDTVFARSLIWALVISKDPKHYRILSLTELVFHALGSC